MSDNKQIMSIQEQIKKQVAALQESTTDKVISINRKGNFQIGAIESDSDTVQVVILAFAHNAAYWEGAWQPGQSSVPDCAATGEVNTQYATNARPPMIKSFDELVPRAAEDKDPQAENCGECPMNVFGTGMGGKGKACKNSYTLAVLPANDPEGHIHKARISASGLKHFHEYLKSLATLGTTWFAVKTTLKSAEAGSGWTIQTLSAGLEPLDDSQLTKFYSRLDEATKMLTFTSQSDTAEAETVTAPKRSKSDAA